MSASLHFPLTLFGQVWITMNPWCCVSYALFCLLDPGRLNEQIGSTTGKIRCLACGLPILPASGIICSNFGCDRGLARRCNHAWHGKCYKQAEKDKFPVLGVGDLDESLVDETLLEDDDPLRFKEARDGDHLMCPFQCDECHFVNLRSRFPIAGRVEDELMLVCIRRAILDSFWSRERSTVNSNRGESLRYLKISEMLGDEDPYPPRGPFPIKDSFGMRPAVALLMRSLDRGRNTQTIQYHTMRKMRSHLSNFAHTCPEGISARFVAGEGSGGILSNSPTNTLWFDRFSMGCHRRMGDCLLYTSPSPRD